MLQEIADRLPSAGDLKTEFVCDENLGHYRLGEVGWEDECRIYNVYMYIGII